jgi:hypothetical protein
MNGVLGFGWSSSSSRGELEYLGEFGNLGSFFFE